MLIIFKQMKTLLAMAVVLLLLLFEVSAPVEADVGLTTLPRREGTQLTIYNSEDITMVREHRFLTVKNGVNRIQFSWANTLIDPTSIDFRILDQLDKVDLLDTTYPPGRNDCLEWNIDSRFDGQIPVEIRYFTSGITWRAAYVGIANADETALDLKGYIEVVNNSGELYDNAEVRLVVGNINLVEKIAELARRPAPAMSMMETNVKSDRYRRFDAAVTAAEAPTSEMVDAQIDKMSMTDQDGAAKRLREEKRVVKQGLSEYFLFAIDGKEDIKDNEPKELVALNVKDIKLDTVYKLSDRTGGGSFTKYYRFVNSRIKNEDGTDRELPAMENLGLSPIPDGSVRLYFEYPNQDLAYVGGTMTQYVAIGQRLESPVGMDKDITIKKRLMNRQVQNVSGKRYRKILNKDEVQEYDLINFDEVATYEEEIISGKAMTAKVEVERIFGANVVLWGTDGKPADWDKDEPGAYVNLSSLGEGDNPGKVERIDASAIKYYADLQPGEKRIVRYTVTYKNRSIGPKLNVLQKFQKNEIVPQDQSKTAPEPKEPFTF